MSDELDYIWDSHDQTYYNVKYSYQPRTEQVLRALNTHDELLAVVEEGIKGFSNILVASQNQKDVNAWLKKCRAIVKRAKP